MMKSKRIRDVVFIAHRYLGLVVGILAAIIGLTGAIVQFYRELRHVIMFRERIAPLGERLPIETLVANAQALFPNLKLKSLEISPKLTEPILASWSGENEKGIAASINPYTGEILKQFGGDGWSLFDTLMAIHINLLGGQWGHYVAGIVGLLATILCASGIVLWPGWRKLATGFKIKWDAKAKRLNFDLHKVIGIVAAAFLSMAMFTGFMWNFGEWTTPILYAITFSPQPATQEEAPVSKPIADRPPLKFTEELLQKAIAILPLGDVATSITFSSEPDGGIEIAKDFRPNYPWWTYVRLDRFSGDVIERFGIAEAEAERSQLDKKPLADKIMSWFGPLHIGTFAGLYSRIFYMFVGLAPTILLITGFVMWWYRKPIKQIRKTS